jgi:hypothetical protein
MYSRKFGVRLQGKVVSDEIKAKQKPPRAEACRLIANMVGAVHRTAWAIEVNRPYLEHYRSSHFRGYGCFSETNC